MLEQASGLRGVIRWLKFILRLFDCAMYICLSINIDLCIHEWDRTLSKQLIYLDLKLGF